MLGLRLAEREDDPGLARRPMGAGFREGAVAPLPFPARHRLRVCSESGGDAMARKDFRSAVAYLRTSSAANTGADKDSSKRQRAAIDGFARSAGFAILDTYYDEAVSGADPVSSRPGFAAMMA